MKSYLLGILAGMLTMLICLAIILFILTGCTETDHIDGTKETEQELMEESKPNCSYMWDDYYSCLQLHKQNLILERIAVALEKDK